MLNQAGLGLGDKVHNQEINEYPDDLKAEYLQLSTWVKALARHYGRGLVVRVIDPQSLVGFWKLVRHRIRRYPALILEKDTVLRGWEAEADLHTRLRELLADRGYPLPEAQFSVFPKMFAAAHD